MSAPLSAPGASPARLRRARESGRIRVALGNGSRSVEEAWAFIKWLLEDGRYAALAFRVPALERDAAAWARRAFQNVPALANVDVLTTSLKLAQAQDALRAHPQAAAVESEVIAPLLEGFWSGRTSVRDGLAGAKRQIQGLLASQDGPAR
jgi:hypothetical protein